MSIGINGFSFSSISTFRSCPRAFEYRYIKKLPEAFRTIEAHMGSCVHETLEWAYIKRKEGFEPTLETALEQYKGSWDSGNLQDIKVVKDDKTREDYCNMGGGFIAYFFRDVFPHDQSTTLYLEHQFQVNLDEKIVYRGVIDRISRGPDATLRVTDYKTGRVGHPLENLQLPSYAMYIFQHNIEREIELCFEDLREQRTMVVQYHRKEIEKVKAQLLQSIGQILDTPDFIAKPSILCLWCGYNTVCDNPHESVKMRRGEFTAPPTSTGDGTNGDYQEACPLCGGQLQERKGKFGQFLGCSRYPRCRYTRDPGVDTHNPAADPGVEGKDVCPECGSLLKSRKGKYGSFMGCSGYPQCRFTRPA